MKWYVQVLKKYAVFSGRAHRTEFWMFFLFNFIISFGLGLIEVILGEVTNTNQSVLSTIYSLAVLIPNLAVGVRRMHDTDHSGWWLIVPVVNLVFAVTKGTEGENRFGPPPQL
ncbi:MAG: DUF805 domain-containing protein [Leptolyngbyaceae cyanobacterium SM2_5_2]|nr:DUF805 domain-containing protein [Leptolyngbyaceae cyanobacterium SM2_5_2]